MGRTESVSAIARIRAGEFITSLQLDPPIRGTTIEDLVQFVAEVRTFGWNTFDVNSSRRELAVGSIAIAARLRMDGCTVIPHITAREALARSICSDIHGAREVFDIQDFLLIRGDPAEDAHAITNSALRTLGGVFDLDTPELVARVVRDLRSAHEDRMGIGVAYTIPPPADACVVRDAKDPEHERIRLRAKCMAGADFIMTQPVFRIEDWQRARRTIDRDPVLRDRPYLVGLWPIFDAVTLRFLTERGCSGVFFPEPLRAQYERFPPTDWGKVGMEHIAAMTRHLRRTNAAAGTYIVTPFRKGLWDPFLDLLHQSPATE